MPSCCLYDLCTAPCTQDPSCLPSRWPAAVRLSTVALAVRHIATSMPPALSLHHPLSVSEVETCSCPTEGSSCGPQPSCWHSGTALSTCLPHSAQHHPVSVPAAETCCCPADGEQLRASAVVLAVGHSARAMYSTLHQRGVAMTAKPFAVGFRVEHPQAVIDSIQYGQEYAAGGVRPSSVQRAAGCWAPWGWWQHRRNFVLGGRLECVQSPPALPSKHCARTLLAQL